MKMELRRTFFVYLCICMEMMLSRAFASDLTPERLPDNQVTSEIAKSNIIVGLEEKTQIPVISGTILTTGSKEKTFVDLQNTRITLGPQSVAEFSGAGDFKLLRGSALLKAKMERNFSTTNSQIEFIGKVLVSFDHREKATSVFVLTGESRVRNFFENSRTVKISRHQGASMITGDVYPSLVRGLDFTQTDEWLAGYHWSKAQRKEILESVPYSQQKVAKRDSEDQAVAALDDPSSRVGSKQNPLADYFSSIYESDEIPKKYEEYAAIDEEKKKPATNVDDTLSPEHAALIPLPSTAIELGFTDVLTSSQALREPKLTPSKKSQGEGRKIASIPLSKKEKKSVVEMQSPEEAALVRLKSLQENAPVLSRGPASIKPQVDSNDTPPAAVVPDPVYDLSENF